MAISATERLVAPAAPPRLVLRGTLRLVLFAAVVLIAAVAIVVPLRASRWARETEAATAALTAAVPGSLPAVSLASIDALPERVRSLMPAEPPYAVQISPGLDALRARLASEHRR